MKIKHTARRIREFAARIERIMDANCQISHNLIELSFVTKAAKVKREQVKRILNKISRRGGGDGSEFSKASVVNIKGKKGPHLILHRGTTKKEGQFTGTVNVGGVHTSTDKRIARAFGADLVGSNSLPAKVKLTGHLSSIAVPAAPLLKRLKKGAVTGRGTRIDPDGAFANQQDIILNRRIAKAALIRDTPVFGNRELPRSTVYKAAKW